MMKTNLQGLLKSDNKPLGCEHQVNRIGFWLPYSCILCSNIIPYLEMNYEYIVVMLLSMNLE